MIIKKLFNLKGQAIIELILAMGLAALIFPTLLAGFMSSREGRVQQEKRLQAVTILKETEQAVKNVRDNSWDMFATNGTYHPVLGVSTWSLVGGPTTVNDFTQQVVISDVNRNANGDIVTTGGIYDPSTKKVEITISWSQPISSSITSTTYFTRFSNLTNTDTTATHFNTGTLTNTQVTTDADGEIKLANNNKGKWCSPAFSSATIDLPDGPPVAVAAAASTVSLSIPNDVFVATAPLTTSAVKMAYLRTSADTDPPIATQEGTFTMDSSLYSSGTFPAGTGLDNSFKTNDIKYYRSASGKLYALLATTKPDKEVVVVQVNDGSGNAFQDPTNEIYKYWTYFNTRIYPNSVTDTGFLSPTANASDTGGDSNGFQTNPTNAYANDNNYAADPSSGTNTDTNCDSTGKDRHRYYNYGITLPSGSPTIRGLEVRLDARVDSTSGASTRKMCVELSWDGGTTWTATKETGTLTSSMATYTLGGSSDTWGRTWSESELSNANFRVRITNVANSTAREFRLDWSAVKIYYDSNDQAPYDYGATAMKIFEDRGYVLSGGFLYVFDLSNIDSKSTNNGLDQLGCRIQVGGTNGADCRPGTPNGSWAKYANGQTGTTYGNSGSPSNNTCADGGNIALYADEAIDVVRVANASNNIYAFVAVGAIVGEELAVVKTHTVPSSVTSLTCGVSDGTDWKQVGSLDFNSTGGEEAANSIYAKSDGSRVYMTSNGGADSKQFYVLRTSTPSSPQFLTSSGGLPTSGFYNGNTVANGEMYPKRSLTVQNGLRAVLVGRDGVSNGNNAEEYQVVNMETPNSESTPTYCGGLDYNTGFNDLTSISELDGDNYVYMVANTGSNELKIIQGGPDNAIYVPAGTFESSTFDAGFSAAYNSFSATVSAPVSTVLQMQVATAPPVSGSCAGASFTYVGPNGDPSLYFTPNSASISGTIPFGDYLSSAYQNPGRCFRYKANLSTSDQTQTPVIFQNTWNYSP